MTASTKPYMIRAIHEWCVDQGFTPYLAAAVDERTRVPPGYARDGQNVLNVGLDATGNLKMGNDLITFQARFGRVAQSISIPTANVVAIYARENGHGMAFELESDVATPPEEGSPPVASPLPAAASSGPPPADAPPPRPGHLKIIK